MSSSVSRPEASECWRVWFEREGKVGKRWKIWECLEDGRKGAMLGRVVSGNFKGLVGVYENWSLHMESKGQTY